MGMLTIERLTTMVSHMRILTVFIIIAGSLQANESPSNKHDIFQLRIVNEEKSDLLSYRAEDALNLALKNPNSKTAIAQSLEKGRKFAKLTPDEILLHYWRTPYGAKDGKILPREFAVLGKQIFSCLHIEEAIPGPKTSTGKYTFEIRLNREGTRRMAKITADNVEKRIGIVFKGRVIGNPRVHVPITKGVMVVAVGLDKQIMESMVREINACRSRRT